MSVATDIAEGIKELLNEAPGGSFSLEFKATRKYLPRLALDEMGDGLFVTIVPKADDRTLISRGGGISRDVPVDVAVQKKLTRGTDPDTEAANDEIDALAGLVEEIANYLKPRKLVGNGVIIRTIVDPIYSPDHLAQHNAFTSVITVAVKVA